MTVDIIFTTAQVVIITAKIAFIFTSLSTIHITIWFSYIHSVKLNIESNFTLGLKLIHSPVPYNQPITYMNITNKLNIMCSEKGLILKMLVLLTLDGLGQCIFIYQLCSQWKQMLLLCTHWCSTTVSFLIRKLPPRLWLSFHDSQQVNESKLLDWQTILLNLWWFCSICPNFSYSH